MKACVNKCQRFLKENNARVIIKIEETLGFGIWIYVGIPFTNYNLAGYKIIIKLLII